MATLAAVSGSTLLPVKSLSTISRCSVSACSTSNARAPAGNLQQKPCCSFKSLESSIARAQTIIPSGGPNSRRRNVTVQSSCRINGGRTECGSSIEDVRLSEQAKPAPSIRSRSQQRFLQWPSLPSGLFPSTSAQSPSLVASASLAAAVGALSLSLLGLAAPETAAAAATADVIAASAAVPAGVSGILDLADFQAGFASAFLLVLFSEIGDKTFFIAAVLATRRPNLEVFAGTFGALAVMTVLSVALGRIFHYADELLPAFGSFDFPLDDVASVVLLVFFGLSTLRDAAGMDSKAEEEQQEAEKAVAGLNAAEGTEGGISLAVLASVFALVFTAEWGDKSFFSTIALAAASSPAGVVTGAVAAHGVATVMAVLGGSFLSKYISEKTVAYVGGTLFLVFAAATLAEIVANSAAA